MSVGLILLIAPRFVVGVGVECDQIKSPPLQRAIECNVAKLSVVSSKVSERPLSGLARSSIRRPVFALFLLPRHLIDCLMDF